jgi:hypothetical protein
MRRVLGRGFERLDDHFLDLLVGHRPRSARARIIGQPIESMRRKARAPRGGRVAPDPEALSDLGVAQTLGREQHDPRSQRQRLRARPATRPRLQLHAFLVSELDGNGNIRGHNPPCSRCPRFNASRH